jgi:hypothetical protein
MAFDPNFPAYGVNLVSQDWRNQFNGLKELVDTQAVTIAAQAAQITGQANEIAAQAGQIATLQALLDTVPPGQGVLTLQYAGGLDVPMLLTAPRATSLLLQRRYQGETDWPIVATLQWGGPDNYMDTLPGTGVFEYRLIGMNNGGPGTPSEIGTVSAV